MAENPPAQSLGTPLALGRTAEVYAWKEGTVLKLYHEWFPLQAIKYEERVARAVYESGIPSPAVGEIIEVNGRFGLVYERVDGKPLMDYISSKPGRFFQYARMLAELQARMHTIVAAPSLPSQHQRMKQKILEARVLPADLQQAALGMLEQLPQGDRLCHGDYHPSNILMTEKGPLIIDWIDSTRGNPLADVARTSLLMTKTPYAEGDPMRWLLVGLRDLFHRLYLRRYFQLQPGSREELARWLIVNAAARLSEGIPEEKALLAYLRAEMPK